MRLCSRDALILDVVAVGAGIAIALGSAPGPAQAEGRATPPASEPQRSAPPSAGDTHLSGHIDMTKARVVDGRFVVALPEAAGAGRAVLTLDPDIQQAAERALERAKAPLGAVVVMRTDGRILALAGRDTTGDKPRPDFDLPVKTWGPAASVFKVVTAAALVRAGVEPDRRVCFHGGVKGVDSSNLRDDPKRDQTCRDLTYGLARSQNALIAKLAHRHLDPVALSRTAAAFGFGPAPRFALAADAGRADIPSADLPFARVAAGFWHTELSPLGGALVANVVATGGMSVTPRIVETVEAAGDTAAIRAVPARRVLAERVARAVGQMMVETTESGSAYRGFHDRKGRAFFPNIQVAGKTGTLSRKSPSYLEYSWFVGYAPASAPEVSIAVLLGNPPKWHLKAHTAARMVLQSAL